MTDPLAHRLAAEGHSAAIYAAVAPAYPHEGCGFVFEGPEGLYVVAALNRAQWLHEKDPERYPRGGADWFEPDMKPWLRATRDGHTPRAIFHSHPDVGAYFSEGDHRSAVMEGDDGAPIERYPGVAHIVVSVRGGVADGARLFRYDAPSGRFTERASFDAVGAIGEPS
jgi:adenylyltransferase/sulfurtransferase